MHKGRTYPFAPHFWKGSGWFWPGYLPWKLKIFQPFTLAPPPWDQMPNPFEVISSGEASSDGQQFGLWYAHLGNLTAISDLIITAERILDPPDIFCRWKVEGTGDVGVVATAYALQAYPQYRVFVNEWSYSLPGPPDFSGVPPVFLIEPATYGEGGSPWPPRPQP